MSVMSKDDLYFFNQGKLYDSYRIFGAHLIKDKSGIITGTRFTVWAPHAKEVNVMGEFNNFQAWVHNLSKVDESGIWSIFVKDANEWNSYKYEIKTFAGQTLYKSDPYAFYSSERPETMSKIYDLEGYQWNDKSFMEERNNVNPYESQMSIYEVHVGSWMTRPGGGFNKYRCLFAGQ